MESGRLDEGALDLGLKNINAASISEHVVNGDDYWFFWCFFLRINKGDVLVNVSRGKLQEPFPTLQNGNVNN